MKLTKESIQTRVKLSKTLDPFTHVTEERLLDCVNILLSRVYYPPLTAEEAFTLAMEITWMEYVGRPISYLCAKGSLRFIEEKHRELNRRTRFQPLDTAFEEFHEKNDLLENVDLWNLVEENTTLEESSLIFDRFYRGLTLVECAETREHSPQMIHLRLRVICYRLKTILTRGNL